MATKKKSKKGKMPAALKAYWARKRKSKKHKTRKNPTPARRAARKAGGFIKSAGRQTMPLLVDAGLGLLGYGAARMIANQAARMFPRKPTDTTDPFVLRMVGVVQFAAGAFLAIKVPKARGVGLGLCIAGLQDGIRRNVPVLAPYLGSDDETMLAYQPIEAPVDLNGEYYMSAPVDMGAADNFLAAPVDLDGDESERYGY
ncbi:MAG: hypothetical protein BWX86_00223 [Verrucomicrobia bacterium ADurb.Bin122]|nr:MAG: hypothetical protein BWX86_00223 [Verrucomicrobia bacterium ADurb.Bin122]